MSGSFDFPPASRRNPAVSNQLQHAPNRHRRNRRLRDSYQPLYARNEEYFGPWQVMLDEVSALSSVPTSRGGSRYRPNHEEHIMRRPRYGRSEGGHHPRNPRYPQQALDRPRMERPPPDPAPDSRIVRTHAVEFGSRDDSNQVEINESNHRRSKYRRLENGVSEKRYIPRYGHRGQVVPGTLNMELIFRDGDLNKEPGANSQRQWPENFLRYDDSVRYSDKSKRNFILRHQGETAFCVKRITFNQWFTRNPYHKNPINIIYGTIFICMDDDDLISRTKLYDFFQDSPSTSSGTSNDGLSLDFDPARDFHVGRPQSRRSDSVFPRVIPPPLSSTTNASIMPYSQSSPSDTSFSPPPSDAVEASTKRFSPTPSSPFEVTIDYNDHSSDDEEEVGYESVRNLTTEVRYERVNSPTDISDEDAMVVRTNQRPGRLTSIDIYRWRYRSRYRPSTSQGTAPGDGRVGSSVHREKPKNDLHPHAKFIIERGKPKVNVSFEPPVSGRFILVKLWSPTKGEDIAVPDTVTMGWAGPRFFPASQLM